MCSGFEACDLWDSLGLGRVATSVEMDRSRLTSDSIEATGTAGEFSCNSEHSRPSFLFNTRRRSRTERVRATSRGNMMVAQDRVAPATSVTRNRDHCHTVTAPLSRSCCHQLLIQCTGHPFRLRKKSRLSLCLTLTALFVDGGLTHRRIWSLFLSVV